MTSPRGLKRCKLDDSTDTDFNSSPDNGSNKSISFPLPSLPTDSRFPNIFPTGPSPKPRINFTSFHRFILAKAPELTKSFDSVSPFLISKWLLGMVGSTKNVKKLRSGDLLIECASHSQSTKLKSLKIINSGSEKINITCESHPTLNSSKGVIRSPELRGVPDDKIETDLKNQNVTSVQRLILNKKSTDSSNKPIPTSTFFLTFDDPIPPESIDIGYIRTPVQPYIPNPLRCYGCQRYGHAKKYCTSTSNCSNCGLPGHISDNCSNPKCCFNCKGDHDAFSKLCPNWIKEKEIVVIKTKNNISYPQAKLKYEQQNNVSRNTTYAQISKSNNVLKKTYKSTGTDPVLEEEWKAKDRMEKQQKEKKNMTRTSIGTDPITEEWLEKERKEKEENHSSSITNKEEEHQKINQLEKEKKQKMTRTYTSNDKTNIDSIPSCSYNVIQISQSLVANHKEDCHIPMETNSIPTSIMKNEQQAKQDATSAFNDETVASPKDDCHTPMETNSIPTSITKNQQQTKHDTKQELREIPYEVYLERDSQVSGPNEDYTKENRRKELDVPTNIISTTSITPNV